MAKFLWWLIWIALISIGVAAWEGFVVLRLYEWFVLSTFTGAPAIGLWEAVGLTTLLGFVTRQNFYFKHEDEANRRYTLAAYYVLVAPAFALLLGYVVHLFIG